MSNSTEFSTPQKIVRSVMLSKNSAKLLKFYEEYDVKFKHMSLDKKDHYISVNTSLCIMESDSNYPESLGGFATYESRQKDNDISFIKYEGRAFYGHFFTSSTNFSLFHTPAHTWVSIIRYPDLEKAKEFYQGIGTWVTEKHGNSPMHYALMCNNSVFE